MPAPQPGISDAAMSDVSSGLDSQPTNLKLDKKIGVPFQRKVTASLGPLANNPKWKTSDDEPLKEWSCSQALEVKIGTGSGQITTPFSISSKKFTSVSTEFGFSQSFLQKVVTKAPIFEYQFTFPELTKTYSPPSYLEIAMSTFENDSFFCLLRYNMKEKSSKVLIFLKDMDHLKERPLDPEYLSAWFTAKEVILQRHPLIILNVIFEFIQREAHQYVRWRVELYGLEARLGVTRDGTSLRSGGYSGTDHDFALLNADLAGLAKKFADTELSASTILEHAKAFQRLVDLCEQYEASNAAEQSQSARPIISEQKEEIQATIIRAELYLYNMKMTHQMLQSLSAVLYNRINKQDTDSMKTIAVVTLVFLPATFVSAIFSTGIFNFHASDPSDHPRTVSKYGWVYLLVCLLSTAFTLVSWVCWYRWGRVWLEKLKFSRMQAGVKRNPKDVLEATDDSNTSLLWMASSADQNDTALEGGEIPPGTNTSQPKRPPSPMPRVSIFNGSTVQNYGVSDFTLTNINQVSIRSENEVDLEAGPIPRSKTTSLLDKPPRVSGSNQNSISEEPEAGQMPPVNLISAWPNNLADDRFYGSVVGNKTTGRSTMLNRPMTEDVFKKVINSYQERGPSQ